MSVLFSRFSFWSKMQVIGISLQRSLIRWTQIQELRWQNPKTVVHNIESEGAYTWNSSILIHMLRLKKSAVKLSGMNVHHWPWHHVRYSIRTNT